MKKFFLFLLIFIVVAAPYVYFLGPQTLLYIRWTPSVEKSPKLYAVPQPMELGAECPKQSSRLAYFGWSFQAPWPDFQEGTLEPPVALVASRKGVRITITGESEAERNARANPPVSEPSLSAKLVKQIWGDPLIGLDPDSRDFRAAMYAASPEDISLWMPRTEALRLLILFPLKQLSLQGLPIPIRSHQGRRVQVFQFGEGGSVDPISVVAYGRKGQKLHLMFADTAATGGYFRQQDFECVVKTLRD